MRLRRRSRTTPPRRPSAGEPQPDEAGLPTRRRPAVPASAGAAPGNRSVGEKRPRRVCARDDVPGEAVDQDTPIRILSKGDDGDVRQSNEASSNAEAGNLNSDEAGRRPEAGRRLRPADDRAVGGERPGRVRARSHVPARSVERERACSGSEQGRQRRRRPGQRGVVERVTWGT